jgi:putative transposase
MPRNPRCVLPGAASHVTQRGVNRGDVFFSQADRETYLRLVADQREEAGVRALSWCLMTNHVHWVVVPEREDSLAVLFRRVHGGYAQYLNAQRGRTGHLWQNRFYGCPVAAARELTLLRYVEWNPVRAGLVETPEAWRWSSAKAHLGGPEAEEIALLDWRCWRELGGAWWKEALLQPDDPRQWKQLRQATCAAAPLGTAEFETERRFGRQWRRQGRPAAGDGKSRKGDRADCALFGSMKRCKFRLTRFFPRPLHPDPHQRRNPRPRHPFAPRRLAEVPVGAPGRIGAPVSLKTWRAHWCVPRRDSELVKSPGIPRYCGKPSCRAGWGSASNRDKRGRSLL